MHFGVPFDNMNFALVKFGNKLFSIFLMLRACNYASKSRIFFFLTIFTPYVPKCTSGIFQTTLHVNMVYIWLSFFYLRLCRVENVHFVFLDFKIENYEFSMTLNVDMVYTKVVAFYTIYNIVVDNFLFDIVEEPKYYLVKSIWKKYFSFYIFYRWAHSRQGYKGNVLMFQLLL